MKDYFFSGWTGNLGVVPLFLLAFFLTAPEAFFLLALLVSETLVLDTINKLLKSVLNQINYKLLSWLRLTVVPISTLIVKIIISRTPYFPLIFLILGPFQIRQLGASEGPLILSVGEHAELETGQVVSYSIGNKDIVKIKYLQKEEKLLIKGHKMGSTELLILPKTPNKANAKVQKRVPPKKVQIYVFSKGHHLKVNQTKSLLKAINLSTSFDGNLLSIKGIIDKLNHLKILRNLIYKKKNDQEIFYLNVTLTQRLKKEVLGIIYTYLLKEGVNEVSCDFRNIEVHCQYNSMITPSKYTKDFLSKELGVTLHPLPSIEEEQNFKVEFELFQIEKSTGEEFSLGLHELNINLGQFFDDQFSYSSLANSGHFREQNLEFKTLAHPKIYTQLNKKNFLNIGSDSPILSLDSGKENSTIDWKFSGLKLRFKLTPRGNKLELDYEIEMTESRGGSVQGTKESSSYLMEPCYTGELFSASLSGEINKQKNFPFVAYLPIIGLFFKNTTYSNTYKKIFLLVHIEPTEGIIDEHFNKK